MRWQYRAPDRPTVVIPGTRPHGSLGCMRPMGSRSGEQLDDLLVELNRELVA